MKIAFIGLGNMGTPMATNLVGAGHEVVVFDLVESAMAALEKEARAVRECRGGLCGSEVVISMLPAGVHVRGLYLAPTARACSILSTTSR